MAKDFDFQMSVIYAMIKLGSYHFLAHWGGGSKNGMKDVKGAEKLLIPPLCL